MRHLKDVTLKFVFTVLNNIFDLMLPKIITIYTLTNNVNVMTQSNFRKGLKISISSFLAFKIGFINSKQM